MDGSTQEIPEIPFVRGEFLDKVTRISYYIKTKALIVSLEEQIKNLEEDVEEENGWSKAKIKRAQAISRDKRHHISLMQRQKERLTDRLTEMEIQIKIDMASENKL